MRSPQRKNAESGYALLFILSMAAIVAIMLFRQLPRVAFEAQRDKEQLLIDRGEQYSRAVNLFVRKFNRYPADFEALNNTQNLRFLRHKYIDPMTGKDDWRIIHVGPGGVFTDSLIYGKKKDDKQPAEQQNFITELQQTGGNPVDAANQNINVGTRQRQSDQPGAPGDPNNPTRPPQLDATGQPIPHPQFPTQVLPNGQVAAGQQPGNQFNGFGFPGQQNAAQGQAVAGGFPGQQQFPPGAFPGQQPNQQQGGPPTAAGQLINQILTTPRPGGLNGLGGVQQGVVDPNAASSNTGTSIASLGTAPGTGPGQTTVGGGMAGVASKLEEEGIKIYKDQTSYHKWEFVYDMTKDPARTGGAIPQGAAPPGTPIGGTSTIGAPGAGNTGLTGTTTANGTTNTAPNFSPNPMPVATPPTQ